MAEGTKKKLKGWQITLIVVASIVVILGCTGLGIYFGIYHNAADPIPVQATDIKGFKRTGNYVATHVYVDGKKVNTFDVRMLFPSEDYKNSVFSVAGGKGTIENNKITLSEAGEISIKVDANVFKFTVVDGVNVNTFDDMLMGIESKENVVLQSNIEVPDVREWKGERVTAPDGEKRNSFLLQADLYGNAYKIDATPYSSGEGAGWWRALFYVVDAEVLVKNVHIIGLNVKKDDLTIDDFMDGGTMFYLWANSPTQYPKVTVEDSVLEKSNKIFLIEGADVNLKGNVIREAADGGVVVDTIPHRTTNLTMHNNVIITTKVAGVMFVMTKKFNHPNYDEIYPTFTTTGVLDIYNWKNEETCALMPKAEDLAGFVNPVIQSTLKGNEFDDQLIISDGHKWIHLGMVVISAGSKPNKPKLNMPESTNYTNREFPIPKALQGLVGMMLKTRNMLGYTAFDASRPDGTPNANLEITEATFARIWG